jgi:hypothetical protein
VITLLDHTLPNGIRMRLIQRRSDYAGVLQDGWLAVLDFRHDREQAMRILSRAASIATPRALMQHASRPTRTIIICE